MNATETEQLAALNKRVFDGETLNDQQESLRKELAALRSQQGQGGGEVQGQDLHLTPRFEELNEVLKDSSKKLNDKLELSNKKLNDKLDLVTAELHSMQTGKFLFYSIFHTCEQ